MTTPTELTRTQVETIINEAHFYTRGDLVDRARMLAHDAALRARVVELEQCEKQWPKTAAELIEKMNVAYKQQLQAREQELADLKVKLNHV